MKYIANEGNVKVIGRTLFENNIRYLNYSCSAIEFKFNGSRVEAELWTDSPTLEKIYQAWVAVFVDGEETPSRRFSLDKEEGVYLLYNSKEPREVNIRLVNYGEAAFGKVGVKSIITDGNIALIPTPNKMRKLEFIGDSITCGYGNEGVWNIDIFNTEQENPWDAYAARTARKLDADYHLISWSGIGIISNWTDQEVPNTEWLMPPLYPYTDKAMDLKLGREPELWNHESFVPDCIIINLGTNDNSYTKNIPERVEFFGKEYYQFVKQVRSSNPSSKILCVLGAMGQDLCGEIEKQVAILNSEGDNEIYYMSFDVQEETDGIGSDWHPSKITHEKMAVKLADKVKEIMKW